MKACFGASPRRLEPWRGEGARFPVQVGSWEVLLLGVQVAGVGGRSVHAAACCPRLLILPVCLSILFEL